MLAFMFSRLLSSDFARYYQNQDDAMSEEFGWKLVHGDVFRPPQNLTLLCMSFYFLEYTLTKELLSIQTKTFFAFVIIVFALLGFLSPSSRGSLANAAFGLYMLFGFSSGYNSSHYFNSYGGTKKARNTVYTIFFIPLIVFGSVIVFNFILLSRGSSSAVPASTLFGLTCIWFLVSIPLSLIGSYFGYKKTKFLPPVLTNQIPRQIPDKPWYLRLP
ncbi:Transmembrane 9 superfamily member 2, partial [Smittium mucronatum]